MSPEKVSKRQERRERMQRQQQRQRLITIGLITLGAALVVLAVIWPQLRPVGEIVTVTPRRATRCRWLERRRSERTGDHRCL